jgi:tetratricopeptide (TPR) repeat protein
MARRKKSAPARRPPQRKKRQLLIFILGGILLACLFIVLAASAVPFLQDDAYISFRYVDNYLAGDGLVFNRGERVEGYTNFLWVILLALAANLGFDLSEAARLLGLLFSAGTVVATTLLARRALTGISIRWVYLGSLAAGVWVAVNPALSYWSVAGLETGLFVFLVTLAVERILAGSGLGWGLLALASLTRPEGALVFAVCLGWYLLRSRIKDRWPLPVLYYVVPLVPFAAFKLFYYGSLLPNPFYAKTGFSPEYWQSGAEYLWLHLQHFGLWGVLPAVLILGLFRARWKSPLGLVAGLWLVYTIYIVSIGGDVLRAHRFFVPVWPVFAVAAIGGLVLFIRAFHRRKTVLWLVAASMIAVAAYQWLYPREYFSYSRILERSIVEKMRTVAALVRSTDGREFSMAASTIGRLSYDLRGHTIIDVLGLTDSTVAKHPETIAGMQTTWKERHFNAGYILSRDPDYILFSTGYKPSAPAERAFILHSKFRQNYFVSLYPAKHLNRNLAVYKRIGEFTKPDSVWPDLQLANDYNDGLNHDLAEKYDLALASLSRMKQNGPGDFTAPDNHMAMVYLGMGQAERAVAYADSALAISPYAVTALTAKYDACRILGDTAMMVEIGAEIARICPWIRLR